jgi:hypothetical protein
LLLRDERKQLIFSNDFLFLSKDLQSWLIRIFATRAQRSPP